MAMTTTMKQEPEIKKVLCKHCNNRFEATTDNFYTTNGKLRLDKCKDCYKKKAKEYEKNRPPRPPRVREPRDRREYYKMYNLKRKFAKQALNNKDSQDT